MKRPAIILLGFYLIVYILPLGIRPLAIPDETRYAEIPREMLASGDWIVPRLDGMRYFEKPVLGYWLTGLSIAVFGENNFAVRLPSALATGATALLVAAAVARLAPGGPASLAAAVYLSFLEVYGIGTFNILDGILALFVTAAVVCLAFAASAKEKKWQFRYWGLCGVCCGLGFLTKGFLAWAVPFVAVVPYLLWERRWRELVGKGWIAVAVAVAVVLPWSIMIGISEPDFWNFFFWNEHIKRFMATDAQHKESFWYFFLLLPAGAMPWTVLVPAAVLGLKKQLHVPLVRFALCWLFFSLLFFSASGGKLITYILPCFAPLAILVAAGIASYLPAAAPKQNTFKAGALLLVTVIALAVAGLGAVQFTDLAQIVPYATTLKGMYLITGLVFWGAAIIYCLSQRNENRKIFLFAAAPILLALLAPLATPDALIANKMPAELLLRNRDKFGPDTMLVSDESLIHAVCWYYRRNDVYIIGGPDELTYGVQHGDETRHLASPNLFHDLTRGAFQGRKTVLFLKARTYKAWKEILPEPVFIDSSGDDGAVLVQF